MIRYSKICIDFKYLFLKILLINSIFFAFTIAETKSQIYYCSNEIDVDSLEKELVKSDGVGKVNTLNLISYYYRLIDPERSISLARKAYDLANSIFDKDAVNESAFYLATAYFHSGDYPNAIGYALDAFENARATGNPMELMPRIELIVMIYIYSGNHDLAVQFAFNIYKHLQQFQKDPVTDFEQKIKMGWVYRIADKYTEAISLFKKCSELSKKDDLFSPERIALNYFLLGDCFRQINQYDSALYYLRKAFSIENIHDIESIDETLYSIGVCYYHLNKLDSSETYFQEALNASVNHSYVLGLATSNLYLGKIEYERKKWDNALNYFSKTIEHASWIIKNSSFYLDKKKGNDSWFLEVQDVPDFIIGKGLDYLMAGNKNAYEICKHINDFRRSTYHLEQYLEAKNQQDILDKKKEVLEIKTRYETERNKQQIIMLEKDNELAHSNMQKSRWALFGISGFLVLIILIVLLFLRQKSLKSEQEKISLQQKLFRSQLKPHFLYNSLASIQKFIVTQYPDNASIFLSRFSRLMRNILESSLEEYVSLDKEISIINDYLALQKTRFEDKFDYSIETGDNLDPENMEIPAMLSQPFIENAIEHGIKHKKVKGKISIRFKRANNYLVLEIEDDGVGREKARELLSIRNKDHKSLATTLTMERIKILNKKRKENISFEVVDFKKEGMASGTMVIFHFPLN